MTDPTRLLDDANTSDGVAFLLRSLSAPEPPSAAKEAGLARQLASLATPTAGAAVGTALWLKAALVIGVLGLAGAWLVLRRPSSESGAPHTAAIASVAIPTVTTPKVDVVPAAPEPVASVGPTAEPVQEVAVASTHSKLAPHDSLADEEALLEQARRLAVSSPRQALTLLQQYQRRFPSGQLAAERLFLSVEVLSRLGNASAAQKQADALIRAFPQSVYAARVQARSSSAAP